MPEHEIFDLDTAFARLEQDVTTMSSAPGAGAAVARARRRRRTTIASVAAATVLAVGGVVVAQGVARHDSATIGPTTTLPTPAPLTAAVLTSATDGWISAWDVPGPSDSLDAINTFAGTRCLARGNASSGSDPVKDSGDLFWVDPDGGVTFAELGDFAGRTAAADASWDALSQGLDACAEASSLGEVSWNGGQARAWQITGKQPGFLWLGRADTSVGVMMMTDVPADVPVGVSTEVMASLVAALQSPESFHGPGSVSSASSSAVATISQIPFGKALGDWHSGWSASSGQVPDADATPCGVDLAGGAPAGTGESLGANGQDGTSVFADADAARAAIRSVGDALAACTTTSYDVHSVPLPDGSVTVAAATGSGTDVVWLVQVGRQAGFVAIPAGGTAPPDSVTEAVGTLLQDFLKESGNTAESSASSGPVEQKASSPATKVERGR